MSEELAAPSNAVHKADAAGPEIEDIATSLDSNASQLAHDDEGIPLKGADLKAARESLAFSAAGEAHFNYYLLKTALAPGWHAHEFHHATYEEKKKPVRLMPVPNQELLTTEPFSCYLRVNWTSS